MEANNFATKKCNQTIKRAANRFEEKGIDSAEWIQFLDSLLCAISLNKGN